MSDKREKFIQNLNNLAENNPMSWKGVVGVLLEKKVPASFFLKHSSHFAQIVSEEVKKFSSKGVDDNFVFPEKNNSCHGTSNPISGM